MQWFHTMICTKAKPFKPLMAASCTQSIQDFNHILTAGLVEDVVTFAAISKKASLNP